MKSVLFFLSLFPILSFAKGDLPSSVPGVGIKNFHLLASGQGEVYRGAQPAGKEDEAFSIGVNRVLIFKKQTKKEVDREIQNWLSLGLKEENITHLPAVWRDVDPVVACNQVIEGLNLIKSSLETAGASLYFHCTQGEDRTGLLAGLFRVLHDNWDARQAFEKEMCALGYEAGSKTKPGMVVGEVRKGLTPLYLKLLRLRQEKKLDWSHLNADLCADITEVEPLDAPANWKCKSAKE